jgi:predicted membrane protein
MRQVTLHRYYDTFERAQSITAAAIATADMQCGTEVDQNSAKTFVEALMSTDTETVHDCVAALALQASSLTDAAVLIVGKVLGLGGLAETNLKLKQLNLFTIQQLQSRLGCMGVEHRPGMHTQ